MLICLATVPYWTHACIYAHGPHIAFRDSETSWNKIIESHWKFTEVSETSGAYLDFTNKIWCFDMKWLPVQGLEVSLKISKLNAAGQRLIPLRDGNSALGQLKLGLRFGARAWCLKGKQNSRFQNCTIWMLEWLAWKTTFRTCIS